MVFELWWRTRRWGAGAAYVLLAGLAVWLHLGAAPLVVAPFLFALGDLVPPRREGRAKGILALTVLGAAVLAALALILVPARRSLAVVIAAKRQKQEIPLASVLDALHLQAGTESDLLAALFWTAALAGMVLLLRDRPRLGALTLTAVAGHLAGLALLSPMGMANPVVLNRYLLPVLPFVLLWVAHALTRPWTIRRTGERGCTGLLAQRLAARVFFLALFWVGPFTQTGFRDGSFMHHNDFVGFYAPRATLPARSVPGFYRRLAGLPGGPVVEFPWPMVWEHDRSVYIYQAIHGRRVLVSAPFDVARHPRIAFRNEVAPEPAAFLASPARYLIVHRRLPWEEEQVQLPPDRFPVQPMRPDVRRRYRQAGQRLARQLERQWGAPDYADEQVRVWDLERLRRQAPPLHQ
jgi:hypothetical protein